MAVISDEMVARVNETPLEVAAEACRILSGSTINVSSPEVVMEVVIFLKTIIEAGLINYDGPVPSIDNSRVQKAAAVNFVTNVQSSIAAVVEREKAFLLEKSITNRFKLAISGSFGYELTESDINRVQELINELRTELTRETRLDEGHKRRLLKRLEDLQKELHKKISDLNHFYNLMGDFGIAAGKLGKDAKPFTDRIKDIIQIGWRAQARAEQLPSSSENPMLGHDGEPPALG